MEPEQVFFNVPLSKLEPVFKRWIKEVNSELRLQTVDHSTLPDRWLDLTELCEYLPDKPTKPTVYGWVHEGRIPVYKGAKKLRFLKDEIDNWMKQGRKKTVQEAAAEADQYLVKKKGGNRV